MPKASIIIPAYNAAQYIGLTIESILSQTFADFECIIIDDGSTDNTLSIAAGYSDKRIKVIAQSNSGGPAKPRNTGLLAAKGDYIFMFDSDDIMHPKKLELSIKALEENTAADILFSNFSSIDEKNEIINDDYLSEYETLHNLCKENFDVEDRAFLSADTLYAALIKVNFIGTSSVVLRRGVLTDKDIFNESLKNSDDRLFWILFTKTHNAVFLNKVLHQYRVQANSISNQGFIRRGPSKIRALEIALHNCDNNKLKKILVSQIAKDYGSLSYAYKCKMDYKNEWEYAIKSIKIQLSIVAIKLLLHAVCKLSIAKFVNK